MSADLLPCPFCGGAATVGPTTTMHMVECNNADCAVNPDAIAPFKHDAIAAWNRRAALAAKTEAPDAAEVIEGLRDLVDLTAHQLDVVRDAITALHAAPAMTVEPEIVAWVRRHPDGALTAEFLKDAVIEPVRKNSGVWVPLGRIVPAVQPVGEADHEAIINKLWEETNHGTRREGVERTYAAGALPAAVPCDRDAALEEAAKECDEEVGIRTKAGQCHPEDSQARDRCFAAARAALNCASSIRALKSQPAATQPLMGNKSGGES